MAMPRKYPTGYYTYVFYDGGVPIYVGAGKGPRIYMSRRKLNFWEGRVEVILAATRDEAFAKERALILRYGRIDLGTGSLRNRTDGLGSEGREWTDEQRAAVSRSSSNPSEAERQRRSERMRRMNITNPPQRGRSHARNSSTQPR